MWYLYGKDFFINLKVTPLYVDENDALCFYTGNREHLIAYNGKELLTKIIDKINKSRTVDLLKIDIRSL